MIHSSWVYVDDWILMIRRLISDIYIAEVSSAHNVCAKDHYLAIVSTIVETDNPQIEIKPGLDLLGPILDKSLSPLNYIDGRFVSVTDLYVPNEDGTKDHCYISKSYDATSHFETTTDDVKDIYRRIMGKPLIVKEKLRPTQVRSFHSIFNTFSPLLLFSLVFRLDSPLRIALVLNEYSCRMVLIRRRRNRIRFRSEQA